MLAALASIAAVTVGGTVMLVIGCRDRVQSASRSVSAAARCCATVAVSVGVVSISEIWPRESHLISGLVATSVVTTVIFSLVYAGDSKRPQDIDDQADDYL